jgi:hypothetical protein
MNTKLGRFARRHSSSGGGRLGGFLVHTKTRRHKGALAAKPLVYSSCEG